MVEDRRNLFDLGLITDPDKGLYKIAIGKGTELAKNIKLDVFFSLIKSWLLDSAQGFAKLKGNSAWEPESDYDLPSKKYVDDATGANDTGWVPCDNLNDFTGFTIKARQIGKNVNIIGEATGSFSLGNASGTGDPVPIFKVPTNIAPCPNSSGIVVWADTNGEDNRAVNIRVSTTDRRQWEVYRGDVNITGYINITYFAD